MSKRFFDALNKRKILLSDGAWGTMLFEKGLKTGDSPESWNLSRQEVIYDIAKQYSDAGADIITTNSFGASKFKLKHYALEDRTEEINFKAASIAKKVTGEEKFVFGSVGPTGIILMMGEVSEEELYEDSKIRSLALEKGGADLILIETMTDLDEAKIAVKAAKENTSLPVACTFTFDKTVTGEFRTMMGVSPEQMLNEMTASGTDVIGTNCGNGLDGMIEIAAEFRKYNSDIPMLVQANAGMPCLIDGKNVFPETAGEMKAKLKDLLDMNVNIVGGCCGTSPEYISAFSEVINSYLHE
jgi:5-methyltetrahydrofolate--homocysteine methyltransferase